MAPRRTRTLRQQEARAGLGLVAALVVRRPFKGRTLVRASMLLPYVAPVVAVTFLDQRTGTLSLLGVDIGVPTALVVVIIYQAWRYFPFSFLFILARLQAR